MPAPASNTRRSTRPRRSEPSVIGAHAAAALVGVVFLVTGALKAIDSRRFERHLRRYGLLPPGLGAWTALASSRSNAPSAAR